jgi:hypothetical protein
MSDASTKRMIEMYVERADAPMFLSGFFNSPARNFHDTEEVEFDVIRDDEDVAVVIQDISAGANQNEASVYTNKSFKPPVFDEEGAISAYDLMKRQPGANPFADPNFGRIALDQAFDIFGRLERKIRRAIELMASQVLQTGTLTLVDKVGAQKYVLNFDPKSSHFFTAGVPWAVDGSSGDPLGDLGGLAQLIRRDGKKAPTKLIFGTAAMQRFLANAAVRARLDNRRMELGQVAPVTRGEGATYYGTVWIDHYPFEMWMYDGYFRAPGAGLYTPYVGEDNVIMLSDGARLDLTYGSIPSFVAPEQRALPFLPPQVRSSSAGIAFTTNAYLSNDGRSLKVSAGTRPLTIPTQIDSFGRVTVA